MTPVLNVDNSDMSMSQRDSPADTAEGRMDKLVETLSAAVCFLSLKMFLGQMYTTITQHIHIEEHPDLCLSVSACAGFAGTPGYLSPEVLRKEAYGKPVDIWACGERFVCFCLTTASFAPLLVAQTLVAFLCAQV